MTFCHGYFTGVGYTYGAYGEPSPERLAVLCLLRSQRPPDLAAPFRLLELGCGQGLHLCLQAANYPQAQFLGIDFNAEHIAHARSLAAAAGLENIRFLQADVLQLEQQPGELLEAFDLVVAHGVLGWVSPPVGAAVLRLASAALRPGGLFYLSYNTLPGWLPVLPFQQALRALQAQHGEGVRALEAARALFGSLREANAQLFQSQPGLSARLDGLAEQDTAYLLHEYNHQEWQPLYVNQVIDAAGELGLSYLGTANLAENFEGLLPRPYRLQLAEQQDPALRELVRDLLTNQSFRRDVYVKGRDPLWPQEALTALETLRLQRLADAEQCAGQGAFAFSLSFGQIEGSPDWFRQFMASLSEQAVTLGELRARQASMALPELLQNLMLLIGKGMLVVVPPPRDPEPAHRFNALVAARVAAGAPYRGLACPLSGNSILLNDTDLIALHALHQGCGEADLAGVLDQTMARLERRPMRAGQPIEGEERQAAFQVMAASFLQRTLPRLRRLGVRA